jgi:D-inositol-3-phosphate glycosyltransferase
VISFVWSAKYPFLAGAGGSENYTAGQIYELKRRNIPVRMLTLGHGKNDGREFFPDIEFKALHTKQELRFLDDTIVYITYPLAVRTKKPSYAILHCPPLSCGSPDPLFNVKGAHKSRLIAASKFAADMWEKDLRYETSSVPVAYPFADEAFGTVRRPQKVGNKVRIMFGGRLSPDKGVYTLLAALHILHRMNVDFELTTTTAGDHTEEGQVVRALLDAHPWVRVIPAGKNPKEVSEMMARHDLVIMPSTNIFWKELFGMVSVEAQHAGCRVVASNSGGLPETDCGGLLLTEPDDPQALAQAVAKAAQLGPLTEAERMAATSQFTVASSVNSLLNIIGYGKKSNAPYKQLLRDRKAPLFPKAALDMTYAESSKSLTGQLRPPVKM